MNIAHDVAGERFVMLLEDGKEGGRLVYETEESGNIKVFTTFVSPEYRGQGVALALLETCVTFARQKGVRIVPVCFFVTDQFRARPEEYSDVIVH